MDKIERLKTKNLRGLNCPRVVGEKRENRVMGLCFSKSDQTPATTSRTNQPATTIQKTAPPQSAKSQRPQESVKTQQSKLKETKLSKRDPTTTKISEGKTVGATVDQNREKLSPQEAARLAAEKRFQESNEKFTRGELGKKLAKDRGKSSRTHVLQESEQKRTKRNSEPLIFD